MAGGEFVFVDKTQHALKHFDCGRDTLWSNEAQLKELDAFGLTESGNNEVAFI